MPEIKTLVTSKFCYRKLGSGPALVLVHGFPEAGNLWRKIQDKLAGSFTLLIPDLPGSGSSPLEQDTSLAQMADCLATMLDSEGISKAVLAGHSMGGYVGFAFAARYPERLTGFSVVHSSPLADDDEKKKTRQKANALIENGGKSAFVSGMIPNLFAEGFKQAHPDIVEEQLGLAMQVDAKSIVNFNSAMIARPDHSAVLDKATFPVQWIIGSEDKVILYKKILRYCAKSDINFVTFYNNCGHMSMLEAPEALTNDLKSFVSYCYRLPH